MINRAHLPLSNRAQTTNVRLIGVDSRRGVRYVTERVGIHVVVEAETPERQLIDLGGQIQPVDIGHR